MYSCCIVPQSKPEYLLNDGTLVFKDTDNNYYRDENNYNYSLLPSIYRNEDFEAKGNKYNFKVGKDYCIKIESIEREKGNINAKLC